jgi:hypothetical protein
MLGLFGKDMYKTEQSSGLLILKLVKSDDVIQNKKNLYKKVKKFCIVLYVVNFFI